MSRVEGKFRLLLFISYYFVSSCACFPAFKEITQMPGCLALLQIIRSLFCGGFFGYCAKLCSMNNNATTNNKHVDDELYLYTVKI